MEHGIQISTITVVHDLTERKHLEASIRESEERFRILSNATFEGILIHDGNGAAIRDINTRKIIEAEKRALEKQLQQKYKMEAVGEMAGGIAHNFNNNLAIILGHVELLERKFLATAQPSFKKYLSNAKTAALCSRDLIAQIMTYSRISSETCPRIKADRGRIQVALHNLCNNAIHAMNESGHLVIDLNCQYIGKHEIPAQYECGPGDYIQISIKDDSCGIAQAKVGKIFDPFFTTKTIGQGTGLGLSTVQGIVRLYGGFITLDSEVNRGTVFTLNFPVTHEEPVTEEQQSTDQIPHGNESILLVDDEEMLVNATQEMLESIGYRVQALQDPHVALQQFSATPEKYDLLITDQIMPRLTGKELVMEVRKIRVETKIILLCWMHHLQTVTSDQKSQA